MEFDQAYNGAVDWNFPSPGATPTNAAYTPNVFHTPKTATFPSHFQDAFATPQMPSYTPRQAEFPNMAAVQRPQSSAEMQNNATYYAHMQMNGHQHSQAIAPPIPVAYQNSMMSPMYDTSRPQTAQPAPAMSYDAMHMQTPPPTRGSSVKKPQLQPVAFGTPSTIASRRFVSPQVAPQHAQHAHLAMHTQHPQLQFSPDMYQFSNFGPASAPVMPQTQLFWDQTPAPHHQQQPTLDDPFAPASSSSMQWSQAPVQQNIAPTAAFNTPAMHSFPTHATLQQPALAVQVHHSQPPTMTTTSVDPSLVYSSPIRPPEQPIQRSDSRQTKLQPSTSIKPATGRKASGNAEKKNVEYKRTDTIISTAESSSTASSFAPSRPIIQRSNTTGTTRAQSAQSFTGIDSLDRRNSVLQVPRTASPLKRVGIPHLGSISESRKCRPPSVVLTVDESGRARAVRTDVHRESSPAKSLRARYPGLYDSDSSDEESDNEATPSRSASFSFSKGQERLSKAARLDPSIENLDGLSIPRTSSAASMKVTPSRAAIAAAASLRRGNSLRKRTPSRNSQRRVASSAIDVAPMDILQDRRQSANEPEDFDRGSFELNEHNRRWSIMSQQSISPTHPPQFFEMQFPQSGARQPARQVRCQCGVNNERGQMVQCSSCTQFQHRDCVGIKEGSALPPKFTCFLCTKPTTRLQVSNRRR
ncbi:Putative Zinc finger, PHD-type, Zinc finger, FYVE/PHD-type, Zinc finger, RING/FYVE/PHD-type [Septoria linicola]|uniref:Zinc finger, PHD-type, Zinc finger, FYVE/PHD-type, Zinc finger, RING/FYVE/PHD-type n=1 Tax=Septoria linicola TaxID=215465 RepID=A0A9Q9AMW8_9PEZI|nr:Putative Zinc finger, PHD-type, Zinc finger, FYVE/PHD-type, Zinc finger, RING/FYVE/PHD-type [Septoria linicola]